MIDLKELYEQGHRRFLFSDGVVREISEVDFSRDSPFRFRVPNNHSGFPLIWYYENGKSNMVGQFPDVVGTESGSPQNVNLERDDNGRWWLEVPQSATVHDITKAAEVLNND